jgi:hypothetical protein
MKTKRTNPIKNHIVFLVALLLAPLAALQATEFVVSTAGNDAHPGTSDQPFRTIGKASRVMRPGDSCLIHGGTYRETLVPPNGTAQEPVVYRAQRGEPVTINGCEVVSGWTLHTGRIHTAPWHGKLGAGNQVFVNRRMAFQARWPNNPSGSLTQPPLATAEKGSGKTTIICRQLPPVDLAGANVWIVSGTRWAAWPSRIKQSSPGSISFANRGYDAIACRPEANFYVFGSLALLDAENEWAADGGQLFLWVPAGAEPATLEVEAKVRYFGIDLSGRKHVQLHGINLFGCSIKTDSATADILVDGMTASYAGHWEPVGEELDPPREQLEAMNLDGHDITVRNSTIFGAAGTLVALRGSDSRVVNCLIHDAGYAGLNSECLGIYGKGHLVSHNTIHSSGRSVIGFGGSRCRVAFNDVSRAGSLTWDVGLFTTGNTDGDQSEICFNWFHDNLSDGLARGIFLSTGAHNFLIHHNVVWNCWEGGFHAEPPMEYIQLLNNTFYTTPGSFDSGGVDVSSFTYVDDQVGGVLANNVFTDDIRTLGHDVTLANNLHKDTDPQFVAPGKFDFRLKPGSPGVGKGRSIPGVTKGRQPDIGAYEGGPWKPGHDFANPPDPELAFSGSHFWNRIQNFSFERRLENWVASGEVTPQNVTADPTLNKDGLVHSGRWGVRLGGGGSGVQQVTAPLTPHTTFVLTGWAKLTTANSRAVLGVTGSFGTKSVSFHGDGQAIGTWLRRSVAFTTGPEEKPVTVFVRKTTAEPGADVLVDDVGMIESLTVDPLLTIARADCDQHRGTGLNQFELGGHWHGSRSWTKDDLAQVRFNGKQIVLYAQIRHDGGIVAVSVDDGPETLVDCHYPQLSHHATVQPTVPVFRSQMLACGPHLLKIRVTGTCNPASDGVVVNLRYVDVLGGPCMEPQNGQ